MWKKIFRQNQLYWALNRFQKLPLNLFFISVTPISVTLGEYSCLQVDLKFARQLSFFVVTIYVPCMMTVSVSWMSFWLDHKAVSLFKILLLASHTSYIPGSCPRCSRCDHPAGNVHNPSQYSELSPTSGLHQGYRCLVGGLCLLCIQCSAGVCSS